MLAHPAESLDFQYSLRFAAPGGANNPTAKARTARTGARIVAICRVLVQADDEDFVN
jgi:hypothetical protein